MSALSAKLLYFWTGSLVVSAATAAIHLELEFRTPIWIAPFLPSKPVARRSAMCSSSNYVILSIGLRIERWCS